MLCGGVQPNTLITKELEPMIFTRLESNVPHSGSGVKGGIRSIAPAPMTVLCGKSTH